MLLLGNYRQNKILFKDIIMAIPVLDTETVRAEYDAEEKVLRVSYFGILSPEVTNQFYGWLIPTMQNSPHLVTEARGSIYDFRQVKDFKSSNITTARKQSQNASQSAELKNHPVALVVETPLQERMVSVMMKLTEQTDRKKLVSSIEEAQDYITAWHKKHEAMGE
jgi:hypothetical protein